MPEAAKTYTAPEGYSYDQAAGLHIFTYQETVPSWWGLRGRAKPSVAFGLAGMLRGAKTSTLLGIVGASIGIGTAHNFLGLLFGVPFWAACGYYLGRFIERDRVQLPPLTGKPGRDGIVRDFQVQLEVDRNGNANLYRELFSSDPKTAKTYEPTQFNTSELVSIERRTWDEAHPDTNRNPQSLPGKKRRDEVRNAEKVVFVYNTGEVTDAGWKNGHNPAAFLQNSLIQFFTELGQHLAKERKQAIFTAAHAPDDEAL